MPRRAGQSTPKYRKHKHSGQAIVTIAGRDYYLGPHGTKVSKLEYDRLIAEWLASGRSPTFATPEAEVSIAELLVAYLRHAKQYYGDGTSEYLHFCRLARPIKGAVRQDKCCRVWPPGVPGRPGMSDSGWLLSPLHQSLHGAGDSDFSLGGRGAPYPTLGPPGAINGCWIAEGQDRCTGDAGCGARRRCHS